MSIAIKLIKLNLKTTSMVSAKWGGLEAFKLFQKVRKKDIRDREKSFFADAYHFKVPHNDGFVDGYILGPKKGSTVFLMHGWDSNAGSLSKIASNLVKNGHQVVAMNLPGHAFSKKSWSNVKDSSDAFVSVLKYINPQSPISFVSHSFGSGIVANGLSQLNLDVDKLIFITTPNKFMDFFVEFKNFLNLPKRTFKNMVKRADDLLGEPLEELSVEDKLSKFSFNHLYLIHDHKDKILPFTNSEKIHDKISNSTLLPIDRAGHYKILWMDEVVEKIEEVLKTKELELA